MGDGPHGRIAAGVFDEATSWHTPIAIGQQMDKTRVQRAEDCLSTMANS